MRISCQFVQKNWKPVRFLQLLSKFRAVRCGIFSDKSRLSAKSSCALRNFIHPSNERQERFSADRNCAEPQRERRTSTGADHEGDHGASRFGGHFVVITAAAADRFSGPGQLVGEKVGGQSGGNQPPKCGDHFIHRIHSVCGNFFRSWFLFSQKDANPPSMNRIMFWHRPSNSL